ncbi:MAG: DUF3341 domain-containing protein [Armatimonadetes bacterium]|nr:DUF3341 domain-containing protein [Armatimonadota bacterium]
MSGAAVSETCQVRGRFESAEAVHHAVARLKAAGIGEYEMYTPMLHHEEMEQHMPRKGSPVRAIAAVGGVAGLALAYLMTRQSSLLYGLITGGKPPVALVPFVVVMFEMTILFAALAAVASLVFFARLNPFAPPPEYDLRFSDDRFGLFVPCEPERREEIAGLLREAGAVAVE